MLQVMNRHDSTNRINNYQIVESGGTISDDSQDTEFGGTSSACPVATGLLATKLQYNRTWTWSNLKTWLAEKVTDQTETAMYTGTESTTANDSNWNDDFNLQGGLRKIIWDAPLSDPPGEGEEESGPVDEVFITGPLIISGDITIS